jgi:hypothetical protein
MTLDGYLRACARQFWASPHPSAASLSVNVMAGHSPQDGRPVSSARVTSSGATTIWGARDNTVRILADRRHIVLAGSLQGRRESQVQLATVGLACRRHVRIGGPQLRVTPWTAKSPFKPPRCLRGVRRFSRQICSRITWGESVLDPPSASDPPLRGGPQGCGAVMTAGRGRPEGGIRAIPMRSYRRSCPAVTGPTPLVHRRTTLTVNRRGRLARPCIRAAATR